MPYKMIKNILLLILLGTFQIFGLGKGEIRQKIEEELNKLPAGTTAAILIINPLTQDTIYKQNVGLSVIPASNTKLFTTAAALTMMGGSYQLKTVILIPAGSLENGTVKGNIYIKGYGNSVFTAEDMDAMVRKLKDMGIKKINGKVIGDDSFFDEIYTRSDWINDELTKVRLPAISALVIDRNRELTRRKIRYKRRGRTIIREITAYKNISDPPMFAAKMLREKLIKSGIKVGIADKGKAPVKADTLAVSGIELRELIKRINKHSDNFLAECLFKTLGAIYSGKQGNSFYSTQAVIKFIKDNGIFSAGTSLVDGSGLSRYDLVTVGAIVGVLEKMYFDLNHFKDFFNSLSIAGVDGTLRHRMTGTNAEDNFHGKTGTLNGVSSLSGYLKTAKGTELVISMIFDFKNHGANYYMEIENRLVEILYNLD